MLKAYNDTNNYAETISLFNSNKLKDIKDHITYMEAIKAYSNYPSMIDDIYQIHQDIINNQSTLTLVISNELILSQLIHCYGKMGLINISIQIFNEYISNNTFSDKYIHVVSSMICAYARNQYSSNALQLYNTLKTKEMFKQYSTSINDINILYLSLINCLSVSGLTNDIITIYQDYLSIINENNYVESNLIKCNVIDSLSRKGLFNDAYNLISTDTLPNIT